MQVLKRKKWCVKGAPEPTPMVEAGIIWVKKNYKIWTWLSNNNNNNNNDDDDDDGISILVHKLWQMYPLIQVVSNRGNYVWCIWGPSLVFLQ